MSSIKRPATLRAGRSHSSFRAPDAVSASLAAVCMATAAPSLGFAQSPPAPTSAGEAAAQSAAPSPAVSSPAAPAATPKAAATASPTADKLPALTVETAAKKKKQVAKPAVKPSGGASAGQAAQAAPAVPASAQSSPPVAAPGANPYADPTAPYKVDRSASTKLTEPLLDTPRTVTTVSKEVLEDKGATSVRDLARTTPGVTLGTGEGGNPFGDRLFIRGFDARNDAYINGLRDSGVPIRETFQTEQLEILKGPSATIGGRGTSGGAVNIVTKQAADQDFTVLSSTLGTDATKRGSLDYNKVISKELSIRANGMWQNADVAGRDEVFDNRWGGAFAVAWKPSDLFKITADYYHLSLDQLPDWGVPWDSVKRQPFVDSGVDRSNYYGYPARDFQKGTQDMLTATAEAKLSPGMTLSSRLRYGVSVIDYVASAPESVNRSNPDPSLWTVQSRPKSRWQENEIVANQTDLTSKFTAFGMRHTLVTGVEVSREMITRDSYTGLTSEAFGSAGGGSGVFNSNLWHPNTGSVGFTGHPALTGRAIEVKVDSASAYMLDTIKLTDQWILTGGLRLDHYSLALDQHKSNATLPYLSRNDLMLNYSAGITYKPVPFASFYAAYGTSSNPVGNELDGNGDSYGGIANGNKLLDPERNTSIELGTKWELMQRHLLATAALFQTDKENAREAQGQLVFSTGTYRIRGVELGVAGNLTSALSLYGGLVVMESEVQESRNPANIGRPFANIAHESFNLLAKYRVTDWFTIGGQATYRGKIRGGTLAANNNSIDDYWRFDALAEVKLGEHHTLQLQVLNVTDEVIYDALYRSGSPFVYVAPGRVGYATLQIRF